jgi:hypothetical protein
MRTVLLLAAVLFSTLSFAGERDDIDPNKVVEKPAVADTPEAFARQLAWIEQEMQPEGRYEFIKPSDKARVHVLLDQMGSMLQRAGSVAAMDNATRIDLFNKQEEANSLLKHNDANRLVCESRAPIGSHIPVNTCYTFRQKEETARNTKIGLQQYDHSQLCDGPNPENGCLPGKLAGSRGSGH